MGDRSWGGFHLGPRSKTPTPASQDANQPPTPHERLASATATAGDETPPITARSDGSIIPRPGQGRPGLNPIPVLTWTPTSNPILPPNANANNPAHSAALRPSSRNTQAPRIGLPRAGSFLSLGSRSNIPVPTHSHFGTVEQSTLREGDRVSRAPSTEQMVEGLQVHMMRKAPRDPIAPQYNAHVMHLLEHYNAIQDELSRTKAQLQATVREKESDRAEFADISAKWLAREEQFGQDIRRLEHIIADKVPNGLANVALARSNSVVRRGGKADQDGKEIRQRIRALLEDRDENESHASPAFPPHDADMNPVLRYRIRLRDDQFANQDLARVAAISNVCLDSQDPGGTAGKEEKAGCVPQDATLQQGDISPDKKLSDYHGPRVEPSPRFVNPGHDFLISERLRHGLTVMAPGTDRGIGSSRDSKQPECLRRDCPPGSKAIRPKRQREVVGQQDKMPMAPDSPPRPMLPPAPETSCKQGKGTRNERSDIRRYSWASVDDNHEGTTGGDGGQNASRSPVPDISVVLPDAQACKDMSKGSSSSAQGDGRHQQRLDGRHQKQARVYSFALGDDKTFSTAGKEATDWRQTSQDILGERDTAEGAEGAEGQDQMNGGTGSSTGSANSQVTMMRAASIRDKGACDIVDVDMDTSMGKTEAGNSTKYRYSSTQVQTPPASFPVPISTRSGAEEISAPTGGAPLNAGSEGCSSASTFFLSTFKGKNKGKKKKNKENNGEKG